MIELPPLTPPIKRSVTIEGHRTSVSLEDAFWNILGRIARERATTRGNLIASIDHLRQPEVGLATALRLFVLAEVQRENQS